MVIPRALHGRAVEAGGPLLEDGWACLPLFDGENAELTVPGCAGEDVVAGPGKGGDGI